MTVKWKILCSFFPLNKVMETTWGKCKTRIRKQEKASKAGKGGGG